MWFLLELHLEDCLNLNLITHSSCSIFEMIYTNRWRVHKRKMWKGGRISPKWYTTITLVPHLRYPFHLGRQHRALKPLRAGGVPTGKKKQISKKNFLKYFKQDFQCCQCFWRRQATALTWWGNGIWASVLGSTHQQGIKCIHPNKVLIKYIHPQQGID